MRLKDLENLENVSINLDAEHPETKHPLKDTFCSEWDKARLTLESIVIFVKNPIVKLIINIVIGIGNGIQGRICNEKPEEAEFKAE